MNNRRTKILFFAGTDTDVGKTYVASLMAEQLHQSGLRVAVYKPVTSGCRSVGGNLVADDAVALWESAGKPLSLDQVCPQKFLAPLAPPEAAAAQNTVVDLPLLMDGLNPWISGDYDVCIVEGAGGLLSPLAEGLLNIDFAKRINPHEVILVAANRLGAIHQTLATVTAADHLKLQIDGIVLNQVRNDADVSRRTNAKHITSHCDVPILGQVKFGDQAIAWLR